MRTVSLRPASVSKFASISNGIALGVVVVKNSGSTAQALSLLIKLAPKFSFCIRRGRLSSSISKV